MKLSICRVLGGLSSAVAGLLVVAGCGGAPAEPAAADQPADAADACGLCAGGKADGWVAPQPGSCEARAMLDVANGASVQTLDVDAALNLSAAKNIVKRREEQGAFDSLVELDAVPYVGEHALAALLAYAKKQGLVSTCAGASTELGLISDLDQTVIPKHEVLGDVAPYPGVAALYEVLELRAGGKKGDVYYVTARTPDGLAGVPEWLETHEVPLGPIETGVSGVPWVAQAEKVRDISALLDAHPGQKFLLFGDTAHRDPEVEKEIIAKYPDRIAGGMMHKVTASVSAERVKGLLVFESYAEAAAILHGRGLLEESEARDVMTAAQDEGLPLTDAEIDALIELHSP